MKATKIGPSYTEIMVMVRYGRKGNDANGAGRSVKGLAGSGRLI